MFGNLETDDRDRRYVTFTQSDPSRELLELPDSKLLNLHAACARVAQMSGAAKAFDRLEGDIEETYVLAFDGSSAPLLDHLLTPFVAISGVA